jgi:type IV pilus assembly protein PilB
MSDKIGYLLFKKGVIDAPVLEKALNIKSEEKGKIKRNLAQILVQDLNFDHDIIFSEVAILYAFRELELPEGEALQHKIDSIKQVVNKVSDPIKQMMSEHKVIPYAFDERLRDKLILAATDPTDRGIPQIAYALNMKWHS